MNFEHWHVFPYAIVVATLCNASGFSGAVLFQPFFYFVLNLPIPQSIATGIATETLGMTSGSVRYALMRKHHLREFLYLLPWVLIGVGLGLFVFVTLSVSPLRLLVGLVMIVVAIVHLLSLRRELPVARLFPRYLHWPIAVAAGVFSASTGTGVAELTQPLGEHGRKLPVRQANANAILLEASADWVITIVNLSIGNIRWDILVFSATGVIIGGQIGPVVSERIPARHLKLIFCLAILCIGVFYIWRA